MMATTKEKRVATSTLMLMFKSVKDPMKKTTMSSRMGSRGRIAYTVLNSAPPSIGLTSRISASPAPAREPLVFLSMKRCQK